MPEDVKKSKEDIEEVLKLFKAFVKENRPSLDIDKVATGETWFGTDALERNLCDEIKTVDDVVTEYIDAGYNVFDVKYEPPPEKPEFASLIPVGVSASSGGIVSRAARWLARTIAAEFKSEMENTLSASQRPDRKYMMKDDASERIRAE
jgi:ClpP class serine protease